MAGARADFKLNLSYLLAIASHTLFIDCYIMHLREHKFNFLNNYFSMDGNNLRSFCFSFPQIVQWK